ncbi:MAG: GTP 3',8-cyclase MoaA [Rhodospirillales bacterium]|nr:GTP 3',8-cyclase MoaA [Rhodospirillales bacterium]
MIDPYGRQISYLRVSVTDRCDLRCRYCMPDDASFQPKAEVLSLDEIDRLCTALIHHGIRKLRLTGGEPLIRKGVIGLLHRLGQHLRTGALDELTLSSNGTQLARHAVEIAAAGVRRINVSVDSLDPGRFAHITRRGTLDQVLAGLAAAKAAGLAVRINTVALRGVNDDEFDRLIRWCGDQGFDLCLIETMPLGDIGTDRLDHYLPLRDVRLDLARRWKFIDSVYRSGGPATYVQVTETGGRLGFITPLSHNFCEGCNRIRLTCTGLLYTCLGQDDVTDLRTPLRASHSNIPLLAAFDDAISRKPKGHDFVIDRQHRIPAVARYMNVTGG